MEKIRRSLLDMMLKAYSDMLDVIIKNIDKDVDKYK